MDFPFDFHISGINTWRSTIRIAVILLVCIYGFLPYEKSKPLPIANGQSEAVVAAGIDTEGWASILRLIQEDQSSVPHSPLADSWLEALRYLPEDPSNGKAFGYSVAIDGNTLVVGAYWDGTDGPAGSGSAYVFKKPDNGWTEVRQVVKLLASDRAMHDTFGWSVDIDNGTVVVGAPGDCTGTPISDCHGSAYVFENQPQSSTVPITEDAKLMPNMLSLNNPDDFGYSVDISLSTIVVGDPSTDVYQAEGFEIDRGMVYVFDRSGASWESEVVINENALLSASDGSDYEYFGKSVAINGNYIVTGAHAHTVDEMVGAGEAYIFYHLGIWADDDEDARLTASDAAAHEYFGWSVGFEGGPIVVGAPGEKTFDNNDHESAYVFIWPGEWPGWVGDFHETFQISATDGTFGDDFGSSVNVDDDVIIVGAPCDDLSDMDPDSGSAYVYQVSGPPWPDLTETGKLTASNVQEGARYGEAVDVSKGIILVGAPKHNVSTFNDQGTAYLYVPLEEKNVFLPLVVR